MTTDISPPLCAPYDPSPRAPGFAVPPNACDCHAHVFMAGYPLIPHGLYTPAEAPPSAYRRLLDALRLERGVVVQPSIYGEDNRAMLAALADDPVRLRGVAVLPFDVADAEIERLQGLGVRGVRCNIVDLKFGKGALDLDPLRALAGRIAPFGWHVELLMHVNEFPDLDRMLGDFPVATVFGHLGYVPVTEGTGTKGFAALLRLMRDGKAWVKLTAPYRMTSGPAPYPEVDEFAHILVETAPERLVWGSDWPHVKIASAMPNDGDLFEQFARWTPDEAVRRRILVDNPADLYGF